MILRREYRCVATTCKFVTGSNVCPSFCPSAVSGNCRVFPEQRSCYPTQSLVRASVFPGGELEIRNMGAATSVFRLLISSLSRV